MIFTIFRSRHDSVTKWPSTRNLLTSQNPPTLANPISSSGHSEVLSWHLYTSHERTCGARVYATRPAKISWLGPLKMERHFSQSVERSGSKLLIDVWRKNGRIILVTQQQRWSRLGLKMNRRLPELLFPVAAAEGVADLRRRLRSASPVRHDVEPERFREKLEETPWALAHMCEH